MKVLIAIAISAWSLSASALTLCLGKPQLENVPQSLNIRLEATFNSDKGVLILQNHADASESWTFQATGQFLEKRQAALQCQKLNEDFQRERFKLALDQKSSGDKMATLVMLSIGMGFGVSVSSGNLCSSLDRAQVFALVENGKPSSETLLGRHLLVMPNDEDFLIMEGALGFIYYQSACLSQRLK